MVPIMQVSNGIMHSQWQYTHKYIEEIRNLGAEREWHSLQVEIPAVELIFELIILSINNDARKETYLKTITLCLETSGDKCRQRKMAGQRESNRRLIRCWKNGRAHRNSLAKV
jgi:hypothetical protein